MWNPKYFEICPSRSRSIEIFGGSSIGYLKIIKEKSLDVTSQREGRVSIKMQISRPRRKANIKRGSEKPWVSLQMRVWATPRLISSAGLSNSALHFKRGSEIPCVSFQMQVWATLRPISSVGLSNSALHFKRGSEKPCVSLQMGIWATPRPISSAGVSNSALLLKRGSEQLRVLVEMRV